MSFASENNPEKTTPSLTLAGLEKWVSAWDPSRFSRNAKLQSLALQKRELAEQARDHLKFCYEILLLPSDATLDEAEELCRQNLQNWDASRFDGESRRALIAEQKRMRFEDVLDRLSSARAAQQSLGDFGITPTPTVTSLFTSGRSEEPTRKETPSLPVANEESSTISSAPAVAVSAGASSTALNLTGFQFPDPEPKTAEDGLKAHERFRQIREERKEAQEATPEPLSNLPPEVQPEYTSSESVDENGSDSEITEAETDSIEETLEIENPEVFSEIPESVAKPAETVESIPVTSAEPEPEPEPEAKAKAEAEAEAEADVETEFFTKTEPVQENQAWIPPIAEIIASQVNNQADKTVHEAPSTKEFEPDGVEEDDGPIFENPDETQETSLFERAILNLQNHQADADEVRLEEEASESAFATDSQIESTSEFTEDHSFSAAFEEIPEVDETSGFSAGTISEGFSLSDFKQSIEEETPDHSGVSHEALQPGEFDDIFAQPSVSQSDVGSLPDPELQAESSEITFEPAQESFPVKDDALGMELDPSLYGGYEIEYAPPTAEAEIEEPAYESPTAEVEITEAAETEAWTEEDYTAQDNWVEGEFEPSDSQQVEYYDDEAQGDWAESDAQEYELQESEWDPTAEHQYSDDLQEVDSNEQWAADQGLDYHQQDSGYENEIVETDDDVSVVSEDNLDSTELEYEADLDFDEPEFQDDSYEPEAVESLEEQEDSEEEFAEDEYSEVALSGRLASSTTPVARASESSDDLLADESDEEEDEEDLELFDEMSGMLDRPKRFQSRIMTFVGAIAVLFVLGGSVAGYYYFSQQSADIEALMEDGSELDNTLAGGNTPSWQDPEDNIPFGNKDSVTASQSTSTQAVEPVEAPAMTAAEAYALGQQMENSNAADSVQRAMDAYEIAASQGMARAQFRLGTLYFEGAAGAPNYVKAAEWYRKAADIGMPEAQFHLACMALHQPGGPGIVKDNPADWLRMASEQGYTNAKVNLALLYLDGAGSTPRDPNLAAYLLRQSADQGNPLGQALLGMMYDRGEGVLADSAQAMDWYQKAVERDPLENPMDLPGLPDVTRETSWEILRHAQKVLASKLLKTTDASSSEQVEQARKLLESAAETKDPQAQFQLGLLYCDAELADTDYPQAKKWFQEAADANYPPAWVNLGWMYENGFGVEKDYLKAEENYLKAVDAGDSLAQYRLGLLYLYGGKGLPSDEVKAYHWIKTAARSGTREAVVKLEEWEKEMKDSKSGVSPTAMEAWQILDSLESGDSMSGSGSDYSELETASSAFNGYSIVSVLKYL